MGGNLAQRVGPGYFGCIGRTRLIGIICIVLAIIPALFHDLPDREACPRSRAEANLTIIRLLDTELKHDNFTKIKVNFTNFYLSYILSSITNPHHNVFPARPPLPPPPKGRQLKGPRRATPPIQPPLLPQPQITMHSLDIFHTLSPQRRPLSPGPRGNETPRHRRL